MNVLKKTLNIILFSIFINFNIKSVNILEKLGKFTLLNNVHYLKNVAEDVKKFYNLEEKIDIYFDKLSKDCFFLNFKREVKEEGGLFKVKKNTYNLEIEEKKFKIEISELLNDIINNDGIIINEKFKEIIPNLRKIDKNKEITFRELCNNFKIEDCKVFLNTDYFKGFDSFKNFSIRNFFNIVLKDENTFFIDIDENYKISKEDFDFYEYNITSRNTKIPPITISNSFYKINNINKYLKNIIRDKLLEEIKKEDIKNDKKYNDITEEFVKKEEIIFLDNNNKITDLPFEGKDIIFFDFEEFYKEDKEFLEKYEKISNDIRNIKIVFIDNIKIDENNGIYIDKNYGEIKNIDFIKKETDDIKNDRINEILKDQINSILNEIDKLYKNIDENNVIYKSYDLKKELFKYITGYNFKIIEFDKKNNIKNEINNIFLNKNFDIKNKYDNSIELINNLKIDDFIKKNIEYNCNLTEEEINKIIDEIKNEKNKNNIILNIKKELFLYLLENNLVKNITEIISNLDKCDKENILKFKNDNINEFNNNKGFIINIVNVINKDSKINKDNTLNDKLRDIYDEYSKKEFNNIYNSKLQEVFNNEKTSIIENFDLFLKEIDDYKIDEKEILDNLKNLDNFKDKIKNDFQKKYINIIIINYEIYNDLQDYINLKDKYKNEFKSKINNLNLKITDLALLKEGDENVKNIVDFIEKKYKEYKDIIFKIVNLDDKILTLDFNSFDSEIKTPENIEKINKIGKINNTKIELINVLIEEKFNLLKCDIKAKKEELKISFNIVIKDNRILLEDFRECFENIVNKYKKGVYNYVSYSDLINYIKDQFVIKTDSAFNLYIDSKTDVPKKGEELIKKGSTIYIAFSNCYYVKAFDELEDNLDDNENSTDCEDNNEEQDESEDGDGVKIIKKKGCCNCSKKNKK